ncbi:hypothetical protein FCN77_25675 [Arthrobacter sp. 24S4-2]|uniref:hypothetical protein n=1 Tax=Arthrobacter sp. 24S4-2 TaxID=2575374 RepID=UPI0010C79C8F|nr:hypothetical protein [Arthrobacter sp. 24S4-2]QCP00476.1 hypothetical protein FCN77_25675 [Arthrobacter sp. 24S4-2]
MSTTASTTRRTTPKAGESAVSDRRVRHRRNTPKKEVTMMKLLRSVLRLGWQPALKEKVLFDGQLLDQKREDVYVVLHQMGVMR